MSKKGLSIFSKPDPEEKIINLNPDNIKEAKEILQTLKKKQFMKKIKVNPLENLNQLKVLRESGFFNLSFLDQKVNKRKMKIKQKDIEDVFRILNPDTNGQKVYLSDLKEKIPFLNSKIPESEIHLLTNNKQHMNSNELFELLQECDYNDFDPVKEVFKMLDVNHNNQVNIDYLISLMRNFNIRKIDEKEKDLIMECLDLDKDGRIGINDIQELLKNEFIFNDDDKENFEQQIQIKKSIFIQKKNIFYLNQITNQILLRFIQLHNYLWQQ